MKLFFGETSFGEIHLAKLHLANFIWRNFIKRGLAVPILSLTVKLKSVTVTKPQLGIIIEMCVLHTVYLYLIRFYFEQFISFLKHQFVNVLCE